MYIFILCITSGCFDWLAMATYPPLKDRIFLPPRSPHTSPRRLVTCSSRPTKYKKWTEEHLKLAYDVVQRKEMSVREAAESFDIPKSTLHDRVSGRVPFGKLSGQSRYLSDLEESELINFLKQCSKIGAAKSKADVLAIVQRVVDKKGLKVKVTNGWWESFKRRHPKEITLRTAEPISYARLVSTNQEVIDKYFDYLEETLQENDLNDKPCQIFNFDESGFALSPAPPKVVTVKGDKHPYAVNSGKKKQITVLSACSAGGTNIPPIVVLDTKTLNTKVSEGEVPGTGYAFSENGWMTKRILDEWFKYHFLLYAPPVRPLLLLMDGASSHFDPSFIETAAENEVIVFCLPPNTTHILQPLDNGPFGPLKRYWREECHSFCAKNPGRVVTKFQFSELFHRAWDRGMTVTNIAAGFQHTGVYPFRRPELETPRSYDPSSLALRTGIKYLPMCTPPPKRLPNRDVQTPKFSVSEISKYQLCFEQGLSTSDPRYHKWLSMYHPGEVITEHHENSKCVYNCYCVFTTSFHYLGGEHSHDRRGLLSDKERKKPQ